MHQMQQTQKDIQGNLRTFAFFEMDSGKTSTMLYNFFISFAYTEFNHVRRHIEF